MKKIDFNKFKNSKKPICSLKGGEIVVGQEIDQDNNLIYIIRKGNDFRASYARDEKPLNMYIHSSVSITKTSSSGTI